MTDKPTPKEIDLLVRTYLGDCGPQANRVYSFVTAVLAKWGQPAPQPSHVAQAAVPADLMTFTSSTQPALQQAHHEEQPDGTAIPIDPSEIAPQQPAPAPMSPANRLVAYSAATRLRELGFEWDATAEAWLQPAPSAQAADSVLEDAARLDWLEQHDGRYYNLDKVAAIVGTGFLVQSEGNMPQVHSTLREAVYAARKQGEKQ